MPAGIGKLETMKASASGHDNKHPGFALVDPTFFPRLNHIRNPAEQKFNVIGYGNGSNGHFV